MIYSIVYIFFSILLLALSDVHGRLPSKIVNGSPAAQRDFQYIVSVYEYTFHKCGGGVISTQDILVNGQCVHDSSPTNLTVHAGTTNLMDGSAITQGVFHIFLHPHFSSGEFNLHDLRNDIAILRLSGHLFLPSRISMLSLPRALTPVDTTMKFAGWGYTVPEHGAFTPHLQRTTLTLSSHRGCEELAAFERSDTFCAISRSRAKAVCYGDNGGPLLQGATLHGIASVCICRPDQPTLFIRVRSYKAFIKHTMSQQ